MKRLGDLIATVDNHMNPVVVKELRQAVQNRMVIAVLLLSLLINVIITSSFLALSSDVLSGRPAGQGLYQTLYAILVGTCMVFVPLYAAARMTMERNNSNIDLLFITTIAPAAIVRGKFWAAAALTALIYSTCMPFLAFTYLLRGIDLPSIFASLIFSFLCTILSIMMAIFVGSISGGMLLRVLMGLGLLYIGAIMMGMTVAGGMVIVNQGMGSFLGSADAWTGVIVSLAFGAAALVLFYLLAVASISAKSSNRMFPIRVFVTLVWLIWGVVACYWSWVETSDAPLMIWMSSSLLILSLALALLPCEREDWSPRVRRSIPRQFRRRFLAWLFYTGSAGGVVWCVLLCLLTLATVTILGRINPSLSSMMALEETFRVMVLVFLFTWCYAMSGVLLRRWLAPQSSPVLSTVLGVVLLGLVGSVPLFLAYTVMGLKSRVHDLPLAFVIANPFVMVDDQIDKGSVLIFLVIWAGLMFLLNRSWFGQQWQAFTRYEPNSTEAMAIPVAAVEGAS